MVGERRELSLGRSRAACRTRSSAGDTLVRLCVRGVLCWPAFPCLSPWLRRLAAAGAALFVGFFATMEGPLLSRSPRTSASWPSPRGRRRYLTDMQDIPVPVQGAYDHAGVSDRAEPAGSCVNASVHVAFRLADGVGALERYFRGSMASLNVPLSTLHDVPRGPPRMTRSDVVRYSFTVWDFHPEHSLPVSRRTSNNIIQKGLAFVRDWSGTVVNSGRLRRSEILPRRPAGRGGASVVRRDAAINRTEDLDVKVCEEAINQHQRAAVTNCRKAVAASSRQSRSADRKPIRARSSPASLRCCNRPPGQRLPR